jgi:TRAP-type C4-dicarboxylate transport system permease small subunit
MVALLFGIIAVLSVRVVWDDYRFEETSPGIGVPQWWYSIWLPVVSALITCAPSACSSAEARALDPWLCRAEERA